MQGVLAIMLHAVKEDVDAADTGVVVVEVHVELAVLVEDCSSDLSEES